MSLTQDIWKRWRDAAGITQQKLAARIGVSQATWSRCEVGEIPLPLHRAASAAYACGKKPADVVELFKCYWPNS